MDQYERLRREKLANLVKLGEIPFRNDLIPHHNLADIRDRYGAMSDGDLKNFSEEFTVAGRLMGRRSFGGATFLDLRDATDKLQLFYHKKGVEPRVYEVAELFDIGDIVWARGKLFKTKTAELTLEIKEIHLLVKCLRPLPEKWHGLTDVEQRYRQRYLDLIMNPKVKQVFETRSHIISYIRQFLSERGFKEVETPMMHPIPGGAAARPFVTHHNKLDVDLYLRVAPELYLKRLLVGGWERIFEINRNFRNEGISIQHNPEFTMIEFYQCYATYEDLMRLTEEMLSALAESVVGSTKVVYQGVELDFSVPFRRIKFYDALTDIGQLPQEVLVNRDAALKYAKSLGDNLKSEREGLGAILAEIFELVVEERLIQPTFVTHFPIEVSPLSRRNFSDPNIADRFELFVYGRELANAFSELNDPDDQELRFKAQLEALGRGNEEAMHYDADFINALCYGMPPAAGEGIGIDRLVMFLTDSPSIRDVILFPQLKPKAQNNV